MKRYKQILKMLGTVAFLSPVSAYAASGIAIVEIDVRQPTEFQQEFFPLASKVFADAGGVFLVKPSAPTAVDDVPPKRVAVIKFPSVAKAVELLLQHPIAMHERLATNMQASKSLF